eukprot:CAMPEP_0201531442 /NCGR_PEP_ID=MMETSP0161_2-20130828/47623_1 /ASSEMBLY_ACC=CAM_ASM_000251 /TAXON_ID=180227 /ORGANISM="Neoparamoeba aestuarina, Strain SoJaBio B1-5/56/2" /LENGTH=436 /DNA_ID=CAMNT_0047934355 /DNA_START=12 /DNA_END=1322 /DNA_ORIENTATION=+
MPSPHSLKPAQSVVGSEEEASALAPETIEKYSVEERKSMTEGVKDLPSLGSLKRTIPSHLFQRSLPRSVFYLLRDFAALFVLGFLYFRFLDQPTSYFAHPAVWFPAYATYAFLQGTFLWALFVVGHDCGHRSFCDSKKWCDIFGTIAHTPLLVPFHAWRLSHRQHHRRHNHVEEDESFVPITRSFYSSFKNLPSTTHLVRFTIFPFLGYTAYLLAGSYPSFHSHFSPAAFMDDDKKKQLEQDPDGKWIEPTDDAIADDHVNTIRPFVWANDSERRQVRESILFVVAFAVAGISFSPVSWGSMVLSYVIPHVVFVAYLSIVTHLHHTHPDVQYYRGPAWSFVRGALSTVNRSYGAVLDHITHDIGEHTVHHLFPAVPHYNLNEANTYLKPALGDEYRKDDTPMLKALFRNWLKCRAVEDTGDVLKYLGCDQVGRMFL